MILPFVLFGLLLLFFLLHEIRLRSISKEISGLKQDLDTLSLSIDKDTQDLFEKDGDATEDIDTSQEEEDVEQDESETEDTTISQGETGETGEQGPQGEKGEKGDPGISGYELIRSDTVDIAAGNSGGTAAQCPADKKIISWGCDDLWNRAFLKGAFISNDADYVTCNWGNESSLTARVRVTVICGYVNE